MGTDCTMIIERKDKELSSSENELWDIVGVCHLPRYYALFDEIREKATCGYPPFINWLSNKILEENEDWGECYMDYSMWKLLCKLHEVKGYTYMKNSKEDAYRCIFRFDN